MSYSHFSAGRPKPPAAPDRSPWDDYRWTARPAAAFLAPFRGPAMLSLVAWWCAAAGLVPGLGLPFGVLALLLGGFAARTTLRDPDSEAAGRTAAAVALGAGEVVLNALLLAWISRGPGG
jgi:hypothetical protein